MTKPNIYITRKLPETLLESYLDDFNINMWHEEKKPVSKEVMYREAATADGVLCLLTEKIDRSFLKCASQLKIVANMAVGYDNIDIQAAKEYGIIITNTPDVLTETTADLTFALLMTAARRIIEATNMIYQNEWGDWAPFTLAGADIHHKTIGIVGMGRIGEALAKRAKGFEMNVLYHNRHRKKVEERELGVNYVSLDTLLATSDFVVSLIPLTADTEKFFDQHTFEKMKSSAIFINASRGGVVDEEALYKALKNGEIQSAGLDVFNREPINASHPLASLPNAVLLPHIGSATVQTREAMLRLCLDNLKAVLCNGTNPITPV